jgi:hypothetical protein
LILLCCEVTRCALMKTAPVAVCAALQAANARHTLWRELCDATAREFAQTPRILGTDNQTVLALTGVLTPLLLYVLQHAQRRKLLMLRHQVSCAEPLLSPVLLSWRVCR